MKRAEIERELYTSLTAMIIEYMENKHQLHLGQFESEFFLDELLSLLAPALYNEGINEAIKSLHSFSERLEEELDLRKVI